ncbi:GroES-like protein [Zopfia rhizophila CBS 207.26]|uniref:GroES-like protein n=1 Tax=Zopfia rhizophila CBS 207.26 TaxID=1314779 RepID=A0A6A6DXQ5_9PEZI|nr:GroES-like protein [Zopfia rhizophila CBS 207.26]
MSYPSTMRAMVVEGFGGPEVLTLKTVPTPEPKDDHVIIRIKSFGINHAEHYMRRGEWMEAMPIIGIECVGIIASSPDPSLPIGTPVAAVMGGLGRTINGSYAEYTRARISNVVKLAESEEELLGLGLDWGKVGSVPETFATAWTVLFRNLEVKEGQRVLIRGGTSSFGRAAIGLAKHAGAEVTTTTRNLGRSDELKGLGAADVLLEGPELSARIAEAGIQKFDAVLELIGNTTLLSSLRLVHRGGRVCVAGFLGGLDPIKDFSPLLQMASGVHLSFFGSFVFGEEFPLDDVPLTDIMGMLGKGEVKWEPAKVFKFGEEGLREAHRLMEESGAGGKMVVLVDVN